MSSLPRTPHDWALWLFATLQDVRILGDGLYRGVLPDNHDFDTVVHELEVRAPKVGGLTTAAARSIEFDPTAGNVYETVEQLVGTPINQERVPDSFTVRQLGYTTPAKPEDSRLQGYLQAVQLGGWLTGLADHIVKVPPSLVFIESPTRKIEISLRFDVTNLRPLADLEAFDRDFVRTDLHRAQKRDMVRATLIDMLGSSSRVSLGALIDQFEAFVQQVNASYAIFAADFSYQKVRTEVEKQNLDDTLRLNKTLADIQNQLLALPAALILAAGSLEAGNGVKNLSIVIGVAIFAVLMVALVANQRSSVGSIAHEVTLRKDLIARQPDEVASRFEGAFTDISTRVTRQNRTLKGILVLIGIVVACVLGMAWHQTVVPPLHQVTTSIAAPLPPATKVPVTRVQPQRGEGH